MTREQIDYLRRLVRVDIRKKERGLEKVAPYDGQSPAEFEAFRADLERKITFQRETLDALVQCKAGLS